MEGGFDASKRKRRDAIAPPSKREKLNSIQAGDSQDYQQRSKANAEDLRYVVKEVFQAYRALSDGDPPASAPFNTLLQASAGDLGSQRLAARLLPRFINKVPDLVETTAAALIRLHRQQQAYGEDSLRQLSGQTRSDALHGLAAVLKAAHACRAPGEAAVRIVLDYLFRLLPQAAAADEPSEPEEEGEVAACDSHTASMHFLRKLLSQALHLHPAITMDHCAACLAAACRPGGSSSGGCPEPGVQTGVRLWLREHLLKECSPSRESTPVVDGMASNCAAVAVDAGIQQASVVPPRGCLLQTVLDTSEELQTWVMQQARSRAAAPPEVRSIIETALQLLPEDKQLVAAKPRIDHGTADIAAAGGHESLQQHQRLKTSSSLPQYSRQQASDGAGFMNGVGPLGRSLSTPSSIDRDTSQAGHGRPSLPAAGSQLPCQFPPAPGPICVAEACLLVLQLPQHISQQEVKQALGAEEAWLTRGAADRNTACCTFKGVLDAAKCYLRHNGVQRLGPHCPAFRLAFAERLPAASSKSADPAHQPSSYVWAAREAVGDAESITEELRAAGMQLSHVHRVNNAAEPGTLLQTPSAAHAAAVVGYLLKKHPQQQPAGQQPAQQQELPPLPPEPPPAGDWAPSRQQQPQGCMPPLPPGLPPNLQQQQQQLDRIASAGAGKQMPRALQQRQQQQQQVNIDGGVPGGRRLNVSPASCAVAAAAGSSWHDSPGEWSNPNHGRLGQQHVPSPSVPPPAPPPLPTAQQATGHAGISPGSSGWQPAPQQQARWGPRGPLHSSAAAAAGLVLPPAPHPGTLPPVLGPLGAPRVASTFSGQVPAHGMHAQQQQQHRQASLQFPAAGTAPHAPGRIAGTDNSPAAVHAQQHGFRGAVGRVLWQGAIVKQSVHMCGVVCVPSATVQGHHHHMAGGAPEPRCWPEQLHVNFRISVTDAVEQYAHTPPDQRAIRLLLPLDPDTGDSQQLQQFINYLNGKERAGMVKLPAVREHGLGPRAVYLIVPKMQVCQQLQVSWDGRDVMLIAVVVPQPGTAVGGHAGAAGGSRQYRG